ncbi:secretin N-terminal domain-containing protein [uncultured Brevundimonas sp.]|uniref:type II secretion system protein GspD n=1 Tax=uncultured Brevundimonas sp. TaxID=213418 RepID=UPI0030EF0D8C|tara:strand:+ start:5907 stop:7472 length:1566 start_codon:yes stop_codon:yes gene_type:complete
MMVLFRWAASVLMVVSLVFSATPGTAQVPSVLEEMTLITQGADQASFLLRFSPTEPQHAAVNLNPRRPELLMRATLRAPRVSLQVTPNGLVRQVSFDNSNGDLLVRFDTSMPSSVKAEPAGNRGVQVTLTRISEEEATGSRPLGSAGEAVVPATDLPGFAQGAPRDTYIPGDAYELVPLKYADVSEVIGLLVEGQTIQPNNVFIRREPGFGSVASSNQQNFNSFQNRPERESVPLGESFPGQGMAIDRRLNAIWITGTPERIARVKDQIALIDIPVDSVILETQFVELTEQGVRNLGIDFNNPSGQIAVGTLQTGANLPFGIDPESVLPSGALQASLYAQVLSGEGRIVSRPRIAAQSGSTAKIITGDALPILTSIALSGVNAVSQQVQYVNVGVTLQIAPRVSSDGFVTSQIYGVVSSVTGFSQGFPTISQREAETSASVRDGETFVIGGLTQENTLTTTSRVPLLGDIPFLGNLFQVNRSTRSKTELYIIITPRIVRHRRFELQSDADPLPAGGTPQTR